MPRGKHSGHVRGALHHRWNAGRIVSSHGYIKVRVGPEHPLADRNGYAYEHLLVWLAATRPLDPDEILHHQNGDKTDNLERLTASEHAKRHNSNRVRDAAGRFVSAGGC